MALNWLGVVSYGIYPDPTPTDAVRARLAVSMGLLTFEFPSPAAVVVGTFLRFKRGASKLFMAGSKVFMKP